MTLRLRTNAWITRYLDELLALGVMVWGLAATAAEHPRRGPLVLNLALVVILAAALLLRRRRPLACVLVTFGTASLGAIWLDDITRTSWSIYLLVMPAYAVAAHCEFRGATAGLLVVLGGAAFVDYFSTHFMQNLLFTTIVSVTAWAGGRAMRHRRALGVELERRAERVVAEREDRERLAVAAERSRIARELQAVVANNVTAMVVQAAAAQRLLESDPDQADSAMAEIESTGRAALSEMREILGVLRRAEEEVELAPQPGLEQLHTLVEQAREARREVGLRVIGEPGPLPVSVDLTVYRVVEEALAGTQGAAAVSLRFDGDEVELVVSGATPPGSDWPTLAMYERVALCEGSLRAEEAPDSPQQLVVRLPRAFEGALA